MSISDKAQGSSDWLAHFDDAAIEAPVYAKQIFRRVGSSQAADGDLFGRRAAMFSAIDAIESLTGYSPLLMLSTRRFAVPDSPTPSLWRR